MKGFLQGAVSAHDLFNYFSNGATKHSCIEFTGRYCLTDF